MKSVKRIEKLINKAEERKAKLVKQVEDLKQESEALYQAVQDDFNEAILNDREPTKKLTSDLNKVREELKDKQFQLSQVDSIVQVELERAKAEVDKERKEFIADKGEEFRELFDRMNKAKVEYLETVIEYNKKHAEFDSEYWRTFRDVEQRVGLRGIDPRDQHKLNLNQRHQVTGMYSPMLY